MADILEQVKAAIEGPIDFPSQKWTEDVMTYTLSVGAILSCAVGFLTQRLDVLIYVFVASILLCLLVVVPPWPQYNRSAPVKWLEPQVPKFE
ncbi:CYFA0S19e01200g1_1 [Cyberlindnera fabianii]|uniref:Signal peptidase complex subunit 1 n=1 Tax=Cyberlindnera fabianii TaxID=36022 RepID=A0A061B6V3_CYBFA|nr:CYFA0S19e01200g1_1 [Cyberlindnera fabianii]